MSKGQELQFSNEGLWITENKNIKYSTFLRTGQLQIRTTRYLTSDYSRFNKSL